ncbi:(2Fe-2S)-binding protein [Novosphingobium sp. BL-52-GroH]|uniref:(2Fe-2S)-binding protein n=1 Tax=Novosphingobium sp. BL-52-GroH TaxID=3349877 RepID=UPI00384FC3FC
MAESRIRFTVNGAVAEYDGRPGTPLLYVLRNELGLKGTRFGCGEGDCGACMVWVDGKPTASCQFPVSSAEHAAITTIEGLADGYALHPLQQSILALNAGQCGYCLNGILMTAAALLAQEANPDRERIAEALDAHLCRCGAHHRILAAIAAAAAP